MALALQKIEPAQILENETLPSDAHFEAISDADSEEVVDRIYGMIDARWAPGILLPEVTQALKVYPRLPDLLIAKAFLDWRMEKGNFAFLLLNAINPEYLQHSRRFATVLGEVCSIIESKEISAARGSEEWQMAMLNAVAKFCPSFARNIVFKIIGIACYEVGRTEDAISYLERAVAVNPQHINCYQHLIGILLSRVLRLNEGSPDRTAAEERLKPHVERAIAAFPDLEVLVGKKADFLRTNVLQMRSARREQMRVVNASLAEIDAEEPLSQSIDDNPTFWTRRALSFSRKKQKRLATICFVTAEKSAENTGADFPQIKGEARREQHIINELVQAARVLRDDKSFTAAILLYRQVLEIDPCDFTAVYGLTICYANSQDLASGLKMFQRLQAIDNFESDLGGPDFEQPEQIQIIRHAGVQVARVYLNKRQWHEAEVMLLDLLKRYGEHREIYDCLENAARGQHNIAGAREYRALGARLPQLRAVSGSAESEKGERESL